MSSQRRAARSSSAANGGLLALVGGLALTLAMVAGWFAPPAAMAVERTFAGSVQLDYHFVPTQNQASARAQTLDAFTTEAAVKVAVDVSEHFSANVKVCFGCHGFETNMAYLDYRLGDELNIRVGRFSPSFGGFNLRHDVANHRLSDKPLAYDMGRMLRLRAWNMSVLPSPFPDNGVEFSGSHWFGERVQLDYAAYAVSGFKGDNAGYDLDWVQSRSGSLYYVDNNSRPTVGGRIATTVRLAPESDVTAGISGMFGTYDPANKLTYAIGGADLVFRFVRTNVRMEYLVRRQEFDTSDPTRFSFELPAAGGNTFLRHGFYAELEHPISNRVDLIGRIDGLLHRGNVLVGSPLKRESSIYRYTVGTSIGLERGLRLKSSAEFWQFSGKGANGRDTDLSFHLALTGSF